MIAASYWSLLAPAIELAEQNHAYGNNGEFAFIPALVGFIFGALFVFISDLVISSYEMDVLNILMPEAKQCSKYKLKCDDLEKVTDSNTDNEKLKSSSSIEGVTRQRYLKNNELSTETETKCDLDVKMCSWKRILLLVIAITVHNIPEGLAVGIAFGAVNSSPSSTFNSARNLAMGIGIQNFPEGLAVSLPLQAAGCSKWKSFWYGQLSGMVEPVAGLLGILAVSTIQPLLPYALAFAAGAMIYVVVNDIIPESNSSGNGKLASWCCVVGFVVMMSLDVGLG
ncbi:zinc transporter ZIP11 isoform X2 [Daktulosphaira vitifoliae]|nr:zinc transporter ZIP11 isoform X2 [Daktulosphaira vitifoliae]